MPVSGHAHWHPTPFPLLSALLLRLWIKWLIINVLTFSLCTHWYKEKKLSDYHTATYTLFAKKRYSKMPYLWRSRIIRSRLYFLIIFGRRPGTEPRIVLCRTSTFGQVITYPSRLPLKCASLDRAHLLKGRAVPSTDVQHARTKPRDLPTVPWALHLPSHRTLPITLSSRHAFAHIT